METGRTEDRAITIYRRTNNSSLELVYTGELIQGWDEDFAALWVETMDEANLGNRRYRRRHGVLASICFRVYLRDQPRAFAKFLRDNRGTPGVCNASMLGAATPGDRDRSWDHVMCRWRPFLREGEKLCNRRMLGMEEVQSDLHVLDSAQCDAHVCGDLEEDLRSEASQL